MRQTYEHSGAVPVLGVGITVLAGLITALVTGVVYTYYNVYVPFLILNIVGPFVFGGCIGIAVSAAASFSHIRNNSFVALIALFSGCFGIYVEWGATPMVLFDPAIGFLGFRPDIILATIEVLFQEGSWGFVDNAPVAGWFLVLFWIAEALCVLLSSYIASSMLTFSQPYCEYCQKWTKTTEGVRKFQYVPTAGLRAELADGNIQVLESLPLLTSKGKSHISLDLKQCDTCNRSQYLSVRFVQVKKGDKGELEEEIVTLLENAALEPDEVELIKTYGESASLQAGDERGQFDFE